jgi:hypothetical protein
MEIVSCQRNQHLAGAAKLAETRKDEADRLLYPQLESLLQNRRAELGLKSTGTGSLSHDLQRHLGLSRGIGISM